MNKRLSLHDALTICQDDVARPVLASWIEQNGLVRLCHETGPLKEAEKLIVAALRAQSESAPPKYILPPADANGKRPRLFYWEDAEDCWCPAEGLEVDNIIGVGSFFSDGAIEEVRFKRMDMTDAEFDAIPEG